MTSSPGLLCVVEGDNVTVKWTLEGVDKGFPLIIKKSQAIPNIIQYVFKQPSTNYKPPFTPEGDGLQTFGFTLVNVQLSHSGEYSVSQELFTTRQSTIFVFGENTF